tara:strand:+ start:279 stop:866 length:588 start_codon:yes stop_codon:yes gene_type:complete
MALTRLGPNQAINLASNTTGTLGVANGGTGLTSGTSGQFLKFTGSTTVASAAAGTVKQVVSAEINSSAQTTSTSFVTTGLFKAITPSSSSNKVIVQIWSPSYYLSGGGNLHASVYRGTSGEGSGSEIIRSVQGLNSLTGNFYINGIISFIDSPASTSALTYTLMQKSADGSTTGYFESGMGGTAIMQISLTEFTP